MVICNIGTLLRSLFIATAVTLSSSTSAGEKTPTIKYDPYQKTELIIGQVHDHNNFFDLDKWNYWFTASIVTGVAKNPMLMFSTDTTGWYFFERAADIDGVEFPVIKGHRDIEVQGVSELIAVELTPKYLEDHRTTGMNLKIIGSRGAKILVIPAETISTFQSIYQTEVEKNGGFRNDLVAAQSAIAPTPNQIAQAGALSASEASARGGFGVSFVSLSQGILLMAVAPNSRADRAGLKPGQLIKAFNGKSLSGMTQAEIVALIKAGNGPATFSIAGVGEVNVAP